MNRKELTALYAYMLNNLAFYEREVAQKQTNLRYRKIDVTDCTELICMIERLNLFKKVCHDLNKLFDLDVDLDSQPEK